MNLGWPQPYRHVCTIHSSSPHRCKPAHSCSMHFGQHEARRERRDLAAKHAVASSSRIVTVITGICSLEAS
jgi:hypothetical protein